MEAIAQFAQPSEATKALIARVAAAHEAGTTLVAKVPKGATIVLTAFQRAVFDVAFTEQARINKAEETMLDKMTALIKAQYGETMPSYKQFRADRAALQVLALAAGLVDDQWVRKPYNAAIHRLYGALPVSDSPAAKAKAEARAKAREANPEPAKPGAVKGNTTERVDSTQDTIEQFVAKHGITKVMQVIAKILASEKATRSDAQLFNSLAQKYDNRHRAA